MVGPESRHQPVPGLFEQGEGLPHFPIALVPACQIVQGSDGKRVIDAVFLHAGVSHLLGQDDGLGSFADEVVHRGQVVENVDGLGIVGPDVSSTGRLGPVPAGCRPRLALPAFQYATARWCPVARVSR